MTTSEPLVAFARAVDGPPSDEANVDGWDERPDDPAAEPGKAIAFAARYRRAAVAEELAAVVDTLAAADAPEQIRAAETLYELFRAAGAAVTEAAPDETWQALEELLAHGDGDEPLHVYARGAVHAASIPTGSPPRSERNVQAPFVGDRLEDSDTRATALELCAHHGIADEIVGTVVDLLGSASASDAERLAAAKALDYGRGGEHPPLDLADERMRTLRDAVEAGPPRVRASVASTLVKQAYLGGGEDAGTWFGPALDAVGELLTCDDEAARLRAAYVVDSHDEWLAESELVANADPSKVATLALALLDLEAGAVADDVAAYIEETSVAGLHYRFPFHPPPAVVWSAWDEFVVRGWGDGPTLEQARGVVARAAGIHPERVPERDAERFVDAAGERDAPKDEAQVLAAIAPHHPDTVVDAVPDLVELAESDDGEGQRQATEALNAIAEVRPDALPVDRQDLLERADPLEGGEIDVEQLYTIAGAEPAVASDTLERACKRYRELDAFVLGDVVERLVDEHPDVVADAVEAVAGAVIGFNSNNRETPLAALTELAGDRPDAVAPAAADLAVAVTDHRLAVRTAAATLLYQVGEHRPGAVPAFARPLVERPPGEADDDPAWPLGVLVAEDATVGDRAVEQLLSTLQTESIWSNRQVGEFVAEIAAGDQTVALDAAERIATSTVGNEGEEPGEPSTDVLKVIVDECPDVADALVEPVVGTRAEGDGNPHGLDGLVAALAECAPDQVRASIEAHFGEPGAFVDLDDGRVRKRGAAAEVAFEEYEPSRFLGVPEERRFYSYEQTLYDALVGLEDARPVVETGLDREADEVPPAVLFDAVGTVEPVVTYEDLLVLDTAERAVFRLASDLGREEWVALGQEEIDELVNEMWEEEVGAGRQAMPLSERLAHSAGVAMGRAGVPYEWIEAIADQLDEWAVDEEREE